MKLYFVRHGESKANVLHKFSNRGFKHGLTERGVQQAEQLALNLRAIRFAKVYTSPLKRACQTAEILKNSLGCPLEVSDALREFDCGELEGKSDPKSWEIHDRVIKQWLDGNLTACTPGGESYLDVRARFIPFFEGVIQNTIDAYILMVGHGGIFGSMLPLVLTNIQYDSDLLFKIYHTTPIIAETRPGGLYCTQWGERSFP
jgi:broad specificity phosphatase PhoE